MPFLANRQTETEATCKTIMKDDLMLDLERKIEKTIYKATLALDENNWSGWFELCDETFTYAITSFSPEINKNMTYFSGDKKELVGLMDMLPKHNTCLLYTSPSPRDRTRSRMPSSA